MISRFYSSAHHANRLHFNFSKLAGVRWNSMDRFPGIAKLVEEKKLHYLTIPEVMDDKEAALKKWLIKEGDIFNSGDPICELAYPSMTIEFSAEKGGILAEMLVNEGQHINVDQPFLAYAADKKEYDAFFDSKREAMLDAARLQAAKDAIDAASHHSETPKNPVVTPMIMLRHIKHLIQQNKLDGESDFAKKLQSLARSGDKSVTEVFEASFDGLSFNEDTFDDKFFLDNAKAIVDSQK